MLTVIFLTVLGFLCLIKLLIHGYYLIHRLQQVSYDNYKFIKWLDGETYRKILVYNLFELFIPLLIILIFYFWKESDLSVFKVYSSVIMILVFVWKIIHPFTAGWIGKRSNVKKPLVFTSRVKRLFLMFFIITSLSLIFMTVFTAFPFEDFSLNSWSFFQFNAFILLFSVLTPMFVLISNGLVYPLEKVVHRVYFVKAKKKLLASSIKKIGITGSYGKTSVKFFLSVILSEKYRVLTTPSSFNTPMGLSKVINDSNLDEYDIFVAEMGADHKGDIKYLSELISQEAGIITAVGLQHLETFGTPKNIISTKLELFDSIPKKGFMVYNYDSQPLREGVESKEYTQKKLSYSVNPDYKKNVDLFADGVCHTREGLEFMAHFKGGESFNVKTELLGKHNVLNLLAAFLTAREYGLTYEEIKKSAQKIKSVEHRLQRIDNGNGVLVLDDAFNSNYPGAVEAINVLQEIKGNKKIVVTPGFVELGDEEDRYNKMFGEYMALRVDIIILVGHKKTSSIKDGLLNGGHSYDRIYSVASLVEAQAILAKVISHGDIVLFENDLPDIYNE